MNTELVPYRQPVISAELPRPHLPNNYKEPITLNKADYKVKGKAKPTEYVYIGMAIDDSTSINEFRNKKNIIKGHNDVIAALRKSTVRNNVRFKTQLFNEPGALNNWVSLADAKDLIAPDPEKDIEGNYKTESCTPLYDASYNLIDNARTLWKATKIKDKKPARFGVMIVSDGEDSGPNNYGSQIYKAKDVEELVNEILDENDETLPNTISFMGVPNNTRVDYIKIANDMGIKDQRVNTEGKLVSQILKPEDNETAIRRAFETFTDTSIGNR